MLFKELKKVLPRYKRNYSIYGIDDLTDIVYVTIDGEYTPERNDPLLENYEVKSIALARRVKQAIIHVDLTKGE
jgi:hypothetical protein